MIEITVRETANEYCIELSGHANYSSGADIVCAGVSAIVYAYIGYIRNSKIAVNELQISSGKVVCKVNKDGAREAFEMAAIGLMQIEKQYPKNIRIEKSF